MMSAWTSGKSLEGRDKRLEDRFKVERKSVDGIRMTLRFLAFIPVYAWHLKYEISTYINYPLCSYYKIMIMLMCLRFCSLDNVTVIKVTIDEALRASQQSSKFFKKSSLNQFLP